MTGKLLRGFGETLITVGMVILLFCAYELYFTGLETRAEQRRERAELLDEWRAPVAASRPAPPAVELGDGLAIMRVPRLGRGYAKVIVEGVRQSDLRKGPGHVPGTALPGAVGNFVVSGHRTTYGAPFERLDELAPGDAVVVETRDTWFTYRVVRAEVVRPSDVAVTLPVPRRPDQRPTRALMTLTTCHPRYSARQRLITYGELVETTRKAPGALPRALQG